MKKGVLKFTACCLAVGMTISGTGSVALADTLAGLGAPSVRETGVQNDTEAGQVLTGEEVPTEQAEETATEQTDESTEAEPVQDDETAGEQAAEDGESSSEQVTEGQEASTEQVTEEASAEQPTEGSEASTEQVTEGQEISTEQVAEGQEASTEQPAESQEASTEQTPETEAPAETEPVVDTSMSGQMAFAQCEEYINVRSSASADSEVVGKVYNNGSVTILAQVGDWYQVQSGNATGYVKAEYFATGEQAQAIADEVAYNVATVYSEALMVRSEPSEDSEPIGTVYSTDELEVVQYEGDWMKVALGNDVYGYVNAYYVGYDTYYATAETLEEEQERLDQEWLDYLAESEAEQERLNQEWLDYLAQQEAAYSQQQAAADQAYQEQLAAEQAAADQAYQEQLAAEQAAADAQAAAEAQAQGTQDAQAAADQAYQEYLAAQEAADQATQGMDEQAVIDTANTAQQEYAAYLEAQAAADAQAQAEADAAAQAQAAAEAEAQAQAEAEAAAQAAAEAEAAAQAAAEAAAQETYEEPVYEEPAYEEPAYEEPAYEEPTYEEPAYTSSAGQEIVNFATQFVGNPYVWGGTSLTNGADCSGFTQSVFANFGISIPRTAASQAGSGTPVDLSEIQAGDLLFYYGDNGIGHVTMYMGNGQVVHASTSSTGIIISDYGYRTPCCARRYW